MFGRKGPVNRIDQALQTLKEDLERATPEQLTQLAELCQAAQFVRDNAVQTLEPGTSPFRSPFIQTAETREYHQLIDKLQLEGLFELEQRRYEFFGLNAHIEKPTTFDEVLKILTSDRLKMAVKEDIKDPRLILLEKSFCLDDLGRAFAAKKKIPNIYNFGERKPRYSQVYLIDGVSEMDPLEEDNLMWDPGRRLDFFHHYKKVKGFKGMSYLKAYHFYMQSWFEGRKIDLLNRTILDEEPMLNEGRYIPTFCWEDPEMLHNHCSPEYPEANTNFRRTLGGPVLKGWTSTIRRALTKVGL